MPTRPRLAELDADQLLTRDEAARLLPFRPNAAAIWRWSRRGLRLADGSRVFLPTHRVGRHLMVAAGDLRAFLREAGEADAAAYRSSRTALKQRRAWPHRRDALAEDEARLNRANI